MKTTLDIQGMHCAACVDRLTGALGKVPGVKSVHVTLSPPRAEVESDGPAPVEALDRAARAAGRYSVVAPSTPSVDAGSGGAMHEHAGVAATGGAKPSLYPLILIVAFIAGIAGTATFVRGDGSWHTFMLDFMAGFFLVFSFFKLLDLRGFADAYQTYDIVAKRSRVYALVYPFIELALGVAYLVRWQPTVTNSVALGLMLIGSVGVLRAVLSKRAIRCACLGTALNLPMTTVTLVEDLGMAAMAAAALVWTH
ncbi:MAG: heavy-metal-associated domain-containing protein [Phycisphaerales bacterium]